VQSLNLTEVIDCGLLIVVMSSFFLLFFLVFFFFFFFFCFFFLCVRVCVYLRMYMRAYLSILCVSVNDNVKHTKSNIRYDNKINKCNKCEIYKNLCI